MRPKIFSNQNRPIPGQKGVKDLTFKSFLSTVAAVSCIFSLLLFYRLIILFMLDRYNVLFQFPLKSLASVLCFSYENGELYGLMFVYLSFFLGVSFYKRARRSVYALFFVLISLWITYRVFNVLHLFYSGWHMEKDFFTNITVTTLGMLLNINAVYIFLLIIVLVSIVFLLFKKMDYSGYSLNAKLKCITGISACLGLFVGATDLLTISCLHGTQCGVRVSDTGDPSGMLKVSTLYPVVAKLPERVLLSSLVAADGSSFSDNHPARISPRTAEKLRTFGIFFDPKRKYPLYKEHAFYDPLPYVNISTSAEKPNVVIFLMESLSARLLGVYGNKYKNITPNMDSFARESLIVRPFFNSSTITVNGVTSSLCSLYPSADRAWGANDDCLLCLPEILKRRGYHAYAIMNDRSMKLYWLRNYVHTFEDKEIRESLKEGYKSPFKTVVSDKQMFRFVNNQLKNRSLQEPFLMTVYTMDLHPPFHMPQDGSQYGDGKNILLNLVFNLDEAFGTFWEHFKKLPYAHNTIVVFTADHAMYPWVDYRKYFYGVETIREYDEIPFIIYDPTHRLPNHLDITSTQVDIVPSLLHLLNIDIPNPFEGHSVFGEMGRIRYPNILGSHPNIYFYRQNNENKVFRRGDYSCKGNEPLTDDTLTPCDYIEWLQFKEYLVKNNLIWNRNNPDDHVPW
jgi:hypothetical protein